MNVLPRRRLLRLIVLGGFGHSLVKDPFARLIAPVPARGQNWVLSETDI